MTLTPVDGIDEPVAAYPELPEPFDLAPQGLANREVRASRLDGSLHLRRKMTNDDRDVRRDADPQAHTTGFGVWAA